MCLLTALTAWVFRQQLFAHWSFPWDFLGPSSTTPAFVADTIGRGHPLFWSPFVASGFPVDVDPQAGVYFPGWWMLGVLRVAPTLRVLTTIQVAHVMLGAVGVLALARARQLAWSWATVAAVAYLFFGGFYGQAEHAGFVRGFAYVPWLLWALTPPVDPANRWVRLTAVPPLVWLIVSGAYPGQVVSLGLAGIVYLGVELLLDRGCWKRYRWILVATGIASVGVCLAVLLPYIRAEQAGELYRTIEPTAAIRAIYAFSPLDFFGLYLNNFSWTYEGTVTSWAVGIPILIGLACTGRSTVRRHVPLVVSGAVALFLGMSPRIGVIGNAMASVRPLFPSRFPSSDYKPVVAIALILISVDAWSTLAKHGRTRLLITTILAVCVLIGGVFLVPTTHGQPTYELWRVVAVVVIGGALVLIRPRTGILVVLLVVLVVVDGIREINDYRLAGVVSPWRVPPSALAFYKARDGYVRKLPERLGHTPTSRPVRVPAATTAEPDASGWVADAYHEVDYNPTIERVLWQAEHNPAWSTMLLAPWEGYVFPCAAVTCMSGTVHLPAPTSWRPAPSVRTISYGPQTIVYSVNVSQPVLMVENELAIPGWRADTQRVHAVRAKIPFRAWRLAPGHYDFSASYHEPGRLAQELAVLTALIAWLICAIAVRRKAKPQTSMLR